MYRKEWMLHKVCLQDQPPRLLETPYRLLEISKGGAALPARNTGSKDFDRLFEAAKDFIVVHEILPGS